MPAVLVQILARQLASTGATIVKSAVVSYGTHRAVAALDQKARQQEQRLAARRSAK